MLKASERPKLEVAKDIATIASSIIVAVSIVSAAWGYWVSRQDLRQDRTLQLEQQFNDARFGKAQDDAAAAIYRAQQVANAKLSSASVGGLNDGERKALRDQVFVAALYAPTADTPTGIPIPVVEITGFFNGLQSCLDAHLCDDAAAHAFFDVYARSFWCSITAVVDYERKSTRPHFADGMQKFVGQPGCPA